MLNVWETDRVGAMSRGYCTVGSAGRTSDLDAPVPWHASVRAPLSTLVRIPAEMVGMSWEYLMVVIYDEWVSPNSTRWASVRRPDQQAQRADLWVRIGTSAPYEWDVKKETVDLLNELGSEGWELVSAQPEASAGYGNVVSNETYVFKRCSNPS
jgi:hypothetical protein